LDLESYLDLMNYLDFENYLDLIFLLSFTEFVRCLLPDIYFQLSC
jgi:hypothetical protein